MWFKSFWFSLFLGKVEFYGADPALTERFTRLYGDRVSISELRQNKELKGYIKFWLMPPKTERFFSVKTPEHTFAASPEFILRWCDENPVNAWDDGMLDPGMAEDLEAGKLLYACESYDLIELKGERLREASRWVFADDDPDDDWGPKATLTPPSD